MTHKATALDLELLAPAGNWDCARAAVENGANAIYFGLDAGFNARARAANFAVEDLPPLLHFLHLRGVRGYVTLNTLVFADELASLEQHVVRIAEAGVDAVLVQDLGVAAWLRRLCPELEVHASTQMTLTSKSGLEAAAELGVRRVVLPRELSLDEIRQLRDATPLGLEAFVHGALCVAYSGQCLTSESLGGRSANRGQCAQACRLPYDLVCDGQDVDLGEVKYLLSPQDLAAHALLPDLLQAGVTSFKIEGRLKTPEYVANVTARYRQALDAAAAGQPHPLTGREIEELELSFSRGFSPGWLQGCDHKMLVPGRSSAKRGVLAGEILDVRGRRVRIRAATLLAAGDGLVFEGDREAGQEQGGRLLTVRAGAARDGGGVVDLEFRREDVECSRLRPGQKLWKTDDPQLTKRLRRTFAGPDPKRKTKLRLRITARAGEPLLVEAEADSGATCRLLGEQPLEPARKHPLTTESLQQQLGRLGGTVYELAELQADIAGEPMAPLSVLGAIRKELVRRLDASREARPWNVRREALAELRSEWLSAGAPAPAAACGESPAGELWVLCRNLEQLRHLLVSGERRLYAEFQDIREYREAVAAARDQGAALWLATPRIEKPGEEGVFHALLKQQPDGVLVRNLGGLRFFRQRGLAVAADFSLNAANELTVAYLKQQGAERITASYDLNREQIQALIAATPAQWLEVVIHQHMPMFHMEHCVFCAVLSPGTNKHNCGRPCDRHQVKLRDRIGLEHPLQADVGCRNTLYNATPQSAAEITPWLQQRGVRCFRVELLEDSPARAVDVVSAYRRLLRGEATGREVWKQLQASNRVGVTRGALEEKRNPLALL